MKKLDDQLLDWFWAGDIVGRQWFVWLAIGMSYGIDLAALLAGLGIGGPLMSYIKGEVVVRETVARALRRSPSSTPALKAAVDYIAAH
jgi:hypothetical protein